jgi:hypothetical protein
MALRQDVLTSDETDDYQVWSYGTTKVKYQ